MSSLQAKQADHLRHAHMSEAAKFVLSGRKVSGTCLLVCDPLEDIDGDLNDLLRVLLCQILNAGSTCIGMLKSGVRGHPSKLSRALTSDA